MTDEQILDEFRTADALLEGDHYKLLADYADYVAAQHGVDALYRDADAWTRHAIANVAAMGAFSSDRAIGEYADRVWRVAPQAGAAGA